MRVEIALSVARTTDGQPLSGLNVTVLNRADDSPALVYDGPTGPARSTNVIVTNSGNVEGWLDTGSYKLVISHPSIVTYTEYYEAVAGDDVKTVLATEAAERDAIFVGPDAPTLTPSTYMWVETGLGTGEDFTVWIEDGT